MNSKIRHRPCIHVHAVIWTGEDKNRTVVTERVVCRSSEFQGVLKKLFVNDDNLKEQTDDLDNLFNKVQSHSCVNSKYRCFKKTDQLGKPVCRVPKYPPCNQHFSRST